MLTVNHFLYLLVHLFITNFRHQHQSFPAYPSITQSPLIHPLFNIIVMVLSSKRVNFSISILNQSIIISFSLFINI